MADVTPNSNSAQDAEEISREILGYRFVTMNGKL